MPAHKPYLVTRSIGLDFSDQTYSSQYPNLHRYPATMLPQIGIEMFKRLNINDGNLLDPYCGSGSSFVAALENTNIKTMYGYDLNPLAILITKAKLTKVSIESLVSTKEQLYMDISHIVTSASDIPVPKITNISYWFSEQVIRNLNIIRHCILKIQDKQIREFFLLAFSDTVRYCSYTRNSEFKLYRIPEAQIPAHKPDTIKLFFDKLSDNIRIYGECYLPKLDNKTLDVNVKCSSFGSSLPPKGMIYDTVLTSPPYGDSRTTVAYGQFSALANEWLGIQNARQLDNRMLGGKKSLKLYNTGIITDYITEIAKLDMNRALEVSAFYSELSAAIANVAKYVRISGKIIYVVGNRTVKGIQLPTDQFIAEMFEMNNCAHLVTYKRALSGKTMPASNSPTNKKGYKMNTMLYEYVVVCEKKC